MPKRPHRASEKPSIVVFDDPASGDLIPFGQDGYGVRPQLPAVIDDPKLPYRLWLQVRVTGRGAEVMTLTAEVKDPGKAGSITSEGLRRVPVRTVLEQVLESAKRRLPIDARNRNRQGPLGNAFHVRGDPPNEWRVFRGILPSGAPETAPGRGRNMEPSFLASVAATYREAVKAGIPAPVWEVARRHHGSRSSAGRWVQQARKLGNPELLGPAVGTVAGEAAPPKRRPRRVKFVQAEEKT